MVNRKAVLDRRGTTLGVRFNAAEVAALDRLVEHFGDERRSATVRRLVRQALRAVTGPVPPTQERP